MSRVPTYMTLDDHEIEDNWPAKATGKIDGGKSGSFTLANVSDCFSDDNFTRLTVTPKKMVVEVFERKGKKVSARTHTF